MPIRFACNCGRPLRVKEEFGGKKVRCPACSGAVSVPLPVTDAENESLDLLLDAPESEPQPRAAHYSRPSEEAVRSAPPPSAAGRVANARPPLPAWKERPLRRDRPERRHSGYAIHPSIITGCLMMLGAVVWLVVGLAFGILFFYPFILFVLGIVAVVKGCLGKE